MNRDSINIKDIVKRRNKEISRLFHKAEIPVRILGDMNPMIIIEDQVLLSCYVEDFMLHFRRNPESDETVKTINLRRAEHVSSFELKETIESIEHRLIYRIAYKEGLYLVGFNYFDSETSEGRFPVFARENPNIYVRIDKAKQIYAEIKKLGYDVDIV